MSNLWLDPLVEQQQVNNASGEIVIGPAELLDPALRAYKINQQWPGTLGNSSILDPALWTMQVNAAVQLPTSELWILNAGTWSDAGVWEDTATWKDS